MKFDTPYFLVRVVIVTCFFSGIVSGHVIDSPDNIDVSTNVNGNTTSISVHHLIEKTTARSHRRLRLKRRRKKKKKYITSTTLSPLSGSTPITLSNHTQLVRKKSKRRRKTTKTRKVKKTSRLNKNKRLLDLESDNLVLPIIPKTISTTVQTPKNKTRCSQNNGGCSHICRAKGPSKCGCFRGFILAQDGHRCVDINECLTNNGGCQMKCTNVIGSHRCRCPLGLRLGIDSRTCEDVNECLLRNGHGPCQDSCENTRGGYRCSCSGLKGTKIGNDSHSCVDLDECALDNGGCSHICINTFGRSFCSCPDGFELSLDFKTCQDIDECTTESTKIQCPNGCINTMGSYKCTDIQGDESPDDITCKTLFPPSNGYFKCTAKHALKSSRKKGKHVVGSKCILACREGFKRQGKGFRVGCRAGGRWIGIMNATCEPA